MYGLRDLRVIDFSAEIAGPYATKLLADAKCRGLETVSGVEMFVNQAALQFEHFTGIDAPVDVMRKVVMDHLTS